MNFSEFAKNKTVGYWFSVAITVLFLVTGITYLVGVNGNAVLDQYGVLNIVAVVGLFLGFGLSAVVMGLQAFNVIPSKWNIVPWLQGVCALLAFCFFVLGAYYYVSVVMVGIDLIAYEGLFIVFVILFVLLLGLAIANIFLKQDKKVEVVDHE